MTYGDKPVWVCTSSNVNPTEGSNIQAGKTPEEAHQSASEINIKHL